MCLAGEAQEYRYAGMETGGWMILCGYKTDFGGGVVGEGGGCPPRKDIRRQEDRVGWVNNKYVTIGNRA